MHLNEYDFFEYRPNFKKYYSIDYRDHSIDTISDFLQDNCPPMKNSEISEFLKNLKDSFENGLFQYFAITINNENDMVYISNLYHYDYSKLENKSVQMIIKLCHENSLEYNIMTKDNFVHLLFTWEKIWENKSPFALLYLDDKNWYDVLPFDTQQSMEKFIAAHIQQENNEK